MTPIHFCYRTGSLDDETIKKRGLYRYYIRQGDNFGDYNIERKEVIVNRLGELVSDGDLTKYMYHGEYMSSDRLYELEDTYAVEEVTEEEMIK